MNQLLPKDGELTENDLTGIWHSYFPLDINSKSEIWKRQFIESVKNQIVLDGAHDVALFSNNKAWIVAIKPNLAKAIVTASLLATSLSYFHCDQIPLNILVAVLPSIFDLTNVKLSKSDEEILAEIPIGAKFASFLTPKEWYDALPERTQKHLNYFDFVDFLDRLNLVGYAKERAGSYQILQKDGDKLRLVFR